MIKLLQTQEKLGYQIPGYLSDFITKLDQPEVKFGEEAWFFWTVTDNPEDVDDNFICRHSEGFKKEWGVEGLIFAANGIGDYLVLLKDEIEKEFLSRIFVMMHETAEIKVFASSWEGLINSGPENYFWNDEFYLKIDEEGKVIKGSDSASVPEEKDFFDEDYTLRSRLDDLIDDERTDHASEIITGLEQLSKSSEPSHKIWALNKLSDIYLKGFGPFPSDMPKALEYNQTALSLNSHKAFSNRAACYFFGMGLPKNLDKALEYATKANDLSKANFFADIISDTKDGGMYDKLVEMIRKEIAKQRD